MPRSSSRPSLGQRLRSSQSALFVAVLATIALIEGVVMLLLPRLVPGLDDWRLTIVDSTLLTLLVAPVLWWLLRLRVRLRASEERFQTLVESLPIGVYRTTPDGRVLEGNRTIREMLGFESAEAHLASQAQDLYLDPEIRSRWKEEIEREGVVTAFELQARRQDGTILWVRDNARAVYDETGRVLCYEGTWEDISPVKRAAEEREKLIVQLQDALSKVKRLSGMLPICASCKRIRDDRGYWSEVETYLREHSEALLSHGICPECGERLYPGVWPSRSGAP